MGLNSALTTMMEADLDAARADWPTEMQMPDGTVVDVTASVARRTNDADGRGFFDQADLIVVGKASDINAAGGIGVSRLIGIRENSTDEWKQYRVETVDVDALITLGLQVVKSRARELTQ